MSSADVNIAKISLIRPGATTHGFDQNQRFVPATFSVMNQQVSGERRYLVNAPTDSMDAPPGDYMLFAVNSDGTPSIASWIQLRTTNLDAVSPSTVSDLAKVCSHGTWAELQWSTPQGNQGVAIKTPTQSYELSSRTNSTSWGPAPHVPAPALDPDASPTATTSVFNLTPGTQYYFRFRTKDFQSGSGNWSAWSNELTFTAYDEQCGGSGGGGGGGHEDPLTAENALTIGLEGGTTSSTSEYLENTLFASLPPATAATDVLRLTHGPRWTANGARIRLSHSGPGATRFTGVKLRGIALAEGQSAFASDGELKVGTLAAPLRVRHADGRDLPATLASESFEGHPGDTLIIEFADGTPGRLALSTSGLQQVADRMTGIELQCELAEGWRPVAHLDPRALVASSLVDVPSTSRVRLVFLGDHRLHGVSRFEPGAAAVNVTFESATISHSRLGELGASLGADGMRLNGGEHAFVDFAVPAEQAIGVDWFLEVQGEHVAPEGTSATAAQEASAEALPTRFILHQNRPNPFDHETLIAFELPERVRVRLEVFDLAGRRVATLANRQYEPGRHGVKWDRLGTNGHVPAGIYLCRMTAGEREFKRQLVVF